MEILKKYQYLSVLVFSMVFAPLVAIFFWWYQAHVSWKHISEEIISQLYLSSLKIQKQGINNLVIKKFSKSDPLYLEHHFKDFAPLAKETNALQELTQSPCYTGTDSLEKRLGFINGGQNRISFLNHETTHQPPIHESYEVMNHPVEVDLQDLQKILSVLESDNPLKPQLIIRDFQLNRKMKASGNEVFDVHISLIKREFQ